MEHEDLQARIDALDEKMDIVLNFIDEQRKNSHVVEDLIRDVSIIGKDVYKSTSQELDLRQVDLNQTEMSNLLFQFLKNVNNIGYLIETLETTFDLFKTLGPIANEIMIDISKTLGEFEQKGYFRFLETVGKSADALIRVQNEMQNEDIPSYSPLKVVRQMNKPEMKKSMGYLITMLRKLSKELEEIN